MKSFLRITCCVFALSLATSAIAEKGGHGKHGGNAHGKKGGGPGKGGGGPPSHSNAGGSGNAEGHAKKFAADDRSAIQTYYRDAYSRDGSCPPGLAKKDNGCMPPGQARRWNAGSTLPADVVIVPVPSELRMRLAPVVVGYEYGYVDGGVVLYAPATRIVVDFVTVF